VAVLTPLPLDDAKRIGSLYGLNVASARGLLAGSVNSNFEVTLTSGERVFLRLYEEQTSATAASEALLVHHLAKRGVPAAAPLARADRSDAAMRDGSAFLGEHRGKPVALFTWVDGEILCQKRVTPDATRRVGQALARVHLEGASFEGLPVSRFNASGLERRLRSIDPAKLTGEIARDVADLLQRLEHTRSRAPEPTQASALETTPAVPAVTVVHGDLFRDNVLFRDGAIVALLDFESAARGSAAFDISVTMLAWCYGDTLDPALCRALADGYTDVRPLTIEERRALFDEACFAAIRFTATRITDYELRPRGSSGYRDYRRFLARLAAIEALGEGGLLTLLGL
jgi:homoserine kinase type II